MLGSVVADLDQDSSLDGGRHSNLPASLLAVVAIVLGVVAGVVAWRDGAEVDRNTTFTLQLERLLSGMKDLETGQRGFLLTGNDAYLDPYRTGGPMVDRQLKGLQRLDLPLGTLPDLVRDRRDLLARGIEAYRTSGAAAAMALVQQGHGKELMDAIHAGVQDGEDAADARIAALRQRQATVALPLGTLALLCLAVAFTLLVRSTMRRRRAQLASNALLEGVLDNAPVGLGFLDRRLQLRRANRALQALGSQPRGANPGLWETLPTLRAALEPRLQGILDGGGLVQDLEVALPDPEHPDDPLALLVSAYPLSWKGTADLGIEGAGLVVLDVSAQKRGERRLRASEERFRTLTQSVSSMIWVTDGDGRFTTPQPEWSAFTGQAFETYRDVGWKAAVHPADLAATSDAWSAAVGTRMPYGIEHRIRRADGAWRHVAAHAVPILDEAGRVREWIGSHTDITERKEAELELEAAKVAAESANRAKSVFLANMSHELRTPLSAVIGYSEMMEEEVEDLGIEALASDLGKIKSNARHLLSLINDVLDLSKIEANRMDVFVEELEIAPLLADVAATVDSLVAKKGNTLAFEPTGPLGTIRTDVVKLRQCLFNLLSNAAKFTERGRITLSARRLEASAQAGDLEIRVADSGIGMSAEQVERLFQRFSQADETTTRKFGGTGLGLAITQAFCRLLGGDIRVESQPGVGSTFIVTLPAVMPDAAPDPATAGHEAAAAHPRGRDTVLVIDDDAAQRDLMARFLERQGFAVRTAGDGRSGIAVARELRPRAILLDVMMPQMDGWSVLSTLKADPDLAAIPVVMVTFVHDTGMGASLGAADYLTKPVHWDKLKAVMDRFRMAQGDVLIVDDDPDARARLATMLGRNGWTTREAGNGREALEIVSHAVPRVILLDLTMPVMDGFSFLEALRERPGCGDVPVIVLTARDLSVADRRRLDSAERVFNKGGVSLSEITREIRAVALPASEPERAEEPSA